MSKHTPGPWKVEVRWIFGGDVIEYKMGKPEKKVSEEEANANARLIAAAPELLEALGGVMSLIANGYLVRDISKDAEPNFALRQIEPVMMLKKAALAIAKAEGKENE